MGKAMFQQDANNVPNNKPHNKQWSDLKRSPIETLNLSEQLVIKLQEISVDTIGDLLYPNPQQRSSLLVFSKNERQEIANQAKAAIIPWQNSRNKEIEQVVEVSIPSIHLPEIIADDIYSLLYPDVSSVDIYRFIRIEALEIPSRAYKALLRAKILRIGQLADVPSAEISMISGIGEKSAVEVVQARDHYTSSRSARLLNEAPLADSATITQLVDVPLSVLPLPKWILIGFNAAQITTVGQLVALTKSQLAKLAWVNNLTDYRVENLLEILRDYIQQRSSEIPDVKETQGIKETDLPQAAELYPEELWTEEKEAEIGEIPNTVNKLQQAENEILSASLNQAYAEKADFQKKQETLDTNRYPEIESIESTIAGIEDSPAINKLQQAENEVHSESLNQAYVEKDDFQKRQTEPNAQHGTEDSAIKKKGSLVENPPLILNKVQQAELDLRQKLSTVTLVGEMAISEEYFYDLCKLVQPETTNLKQPKIKNIPAGLFITLMVFTARFASDEGRNFWTPFANMVWGFPEATSKFQAECRQRFKTAANELEQAFPNLLPFTQVSGGDVVRPIYRHAILPIYLKDDFVQWLQKEWNNILDIPTDSLAEALQTDKRIDSYSRPLAEFLQSEETQETAIALITQLADGIRQVQNSQTEQTVGIQWPPHTIHFEIWSAINENLQDSTDTKAISRMGQGKVEWVWDIEEPDIYIRLRNLTLQQKPEKVVWQEADAEVFCNPWQLENGVWWLDEIHIAFESFTRSGELVVLNANEDVISRVTIPPLPDQPWLLFQLESNQETAVFRDKINQKHWYCFSAEDAVTLQGDVLFQKAFPLPPLLQQLSGHQHAGLYYLTLPVTVNQGDNLLTEFSEDEDTTKEPPSLTGKNPINGTSPNLPPVYQDTAITLKIPNPQPDTVLWLKWGQETQKIPLVQLPSQSEAMIVDLKSYLLPTPATYSVQIRQGLRPILQTPLEFTTLPDIQVSAPSPNRVYSSSLLPTCTLRGLDPKNILPNPRYKFETHPDSSIFLTWTDLREDDCRIALQFNQQTVHLGWPMPQRIYSWVEPSSPYGFVRESDLAETTIHVIAPNERKFPQGRAYKYFEAWIVGKEYDTRKISFRKQRHLSKSLIQPRDSLYDMIHEFIRKQPEQLVQVKARMYGEIWTLLEVRPQPQINHASIQYESENKNILFNCDIAIPWVGQISFRLYDLHQPFVQPQNWEFDTLETNHTLPFEIPNATYDYLLSIHCDSQRLPLPQPLRLSQGNQAVYHSPDIALLFDHIQQQIQGPVPQSCSDDFLRLTAYYRADEQSHIINNKELYQFTTLAFSNKCELPENDLAMLWPGLNRLHLVQDVKSWTAKHGLLPSWAVLDQPFKFQLNKYPKVTFRVFPEEALEQGKRGIGYAYLTLEDDQTEKVYVSWQPYFGPYIKVKVGRLSNYDDKTLFSRMDTQELHIIKQCSYCGGFIKVETPQTRSLHSRCIKLFNASFESVTERGDLVSTQRLENSTLHHLESPSLFVDHQLTAMLWHQNEYPDIEDHPNPISKAAYQYAAAQWIQRYQTDSQNQQLVDQIINFKRRNFKKFADRLEEFDIPAYQSVARFLKVFNLNETPPALDQKILLLTLLLRTQAHHPIRSSKILEEVGIKTKEFEQILENIQLICPELLLWALTWVELFFIHARA